MPFKIGTPLVTFVCAMTLLAVAGAVAPSHGQQNPPKVTKEEDETFEPGHLEKAAKVIELTRSAEAFDDILPFVADQTMTLFMRNNPAISGDIQEVTTEVAINMAKRRIELNETLKKVWARRFTPDELDELAAFFGSETGQKFASLTPVITALSLGASRQWQDKLATEMVTQVRAGLKERGYDL